MKSSSLVKLCKLLCCVVCIIAAHSGFALGAKGDTECAAGSGETCGVKFPSSNSFVHADYPVNFKRVKDMFASRTSGFSEDTLLELNYGAKRTANGHMDFMVDHVQTMAQDNVSGFRPWGERDGVKYETHDLYTYRGGGAGYFRLKAELECNEELFVSLLMDAEAISVMDETVRVMEFFYDYPDKQTWLNYWRASPGPTFSDIDGIDITGWRKANGKLYQVSVSVPHELPMTEGAYRGVDLYWGYEIEPILNSSGEKSGRFRMTLISQTILNNWLPNFLAKIKIGDVLADYVRTIERTANQKESEGKLGYYLKKYGFQE